MKPITSFNSIGAPVNVVISNMTAFINKVMEVRNFRYFETIVQPQMGPVTIGNPNGQLLYNVTMIFEAETQEDLDELLKWQAGQLKDAANEQTGATVLRSMP